MRKLMVIIPDRLSNIISKGEIIDRYYNPGDLFGEVHLVITNNDTPNTKVLQRMVGNAQLYMHNLFDSKLAFVLSLGWRPWLLTLWARKAIALAANIKPDLIRCHGASLNSFAATCIKKELGIPYVVSMHTNPIEDIRLINGSIIRKTISILHQKIEKIGLVNANLVMPVYKSIIPYLETIGVNNIELCYNVINPKHIKEKQHYSLKKTIKVLSVGRQFEGKNPDNLVRAVAQIKNIELTIVGDGSYHKQLVRLVNECNIKDRVVFHRSIPNDQLCDILPDFDIFATHTEYWEISKSILEPLLSGLPVVLNKRIGKPVPELNSEICILVENTVDGYYAALNKLINNAEYRENLGRSAYKHAQEIWSPEITEGKFVSIYKGLIKKSQYD